MVNSTIESFYEDIVSKRYLETKNYEDLSYDEKQLVNECYALYRQVYDLTELQFVTD